MANREGYERCQRQKKLFCIRDARNVPQLDALSSLIFLKPLSEPNSIWTFQAFSYISDLESFQSWNFHIAAMLHPAKARLPARNNLEGK